MKLEDLPSKSMFSRGSRPSGALTFGRISQASHAPLGLLQPGLTYDSPSRAASAYNCTQIFFLSLTVQKFKIWTLTANPNILSHPRLYNLALTRRVTVEQLFFRFLTQERIIPLIGTCSEKHMQEDLAIFEFTLTDDEINQIKILLI